MGYFFFKHQKFSHKHHKHFIYNYFIKKQNWIK